MQKFLISALCFIVFFTAEAQTKIGLKFSPFFSTNRVNLRYNDLSQDTLDITKDQTFTRFSLGLIVDQSLTDTYVFSTGIVFIPKRIGFTVEPENGAFFSPITEAYNLQYLQLPVSLKLFTNEVLPDLSIFFQVGAGAEFRIFDSPVEETYNFIEEFNPFDLSVILSAGTEYRAGVNTVLFADVSYQRGLLNTVKTTTVPLPENFSIRSTVIMIDLGIKF